MRNKEEDIVLDDKFFSSFFNKESHKEIVYRKTTFLKTPNSWSKTDLSFNINFRSNILTIFCKNIDERIINEYTLGNLWPGLILRLEDFWWWKQEGIESLLKLVANGDGTKRGRKLMFEKIEFKKLDMVCLLDNDLTLFNAFLKSAKGIYELNFENNTISELMIRKGIKSAIVMNDRSKTNAELWKYLSNAYFNNHLTVIDKWKGICQIQSMKNYDSCKTLKELALREYDFYEKRIGMKK